MTDFQLDFKVYENKQVIFNDEQIDVTGIGEIKAMPRRRGLGELCFNYVRDNFSWPIVCFFEEENVKFYEYLCQKHNGGIAKNKNYRGSYIFYYPALKNPPMIDSLGEYW